MALIAQLRLDVPGEWHIPHEVRADGVLEYIRHDMRAKAFGALSAHMAAMLALTKLAVLFLPSPEPAGSDREGTTTTAPVPGAAETESSGKVHTWIFVIYVFGVVLMLVVLVLEICNILDLGRKLRYLTCNALLVAIVVVGVPGQRDFVQLHTLLTELLFFQYFCDKPLVFLGAIAFTSRTYGQRDLLQLGTLLPELLSVLSATLALATGISLALSARLRARPQDPVRDDPALLGRLAGKGVVLAGVKVAGPAPCALPSLPLLIAWFAAAWLGRACAGVHWDAVITSFAVVWLFLIDADGPLQSGDPDDHLRVVVLFHSKWGLLPLTAALQWLCAALAGPSSRGSWFFPSLVVNLAIVTFPEVRKHLVRSWPGPPPAQAAEQIERDRQRTRRLQRERDPEAAERREILRNLRAAHALLVQTRIRVEALNAEAIEMNEALVDLVEMTRQRREGRVADREMSAEGRPAAAAAEGEEPPV